MPSSPIETSTRVESVKVLVTSKRDQQALETSLGEVDGDWIAAIDHLKTMLMPKSLGRIAFAHALAEWSSDSLSVMSAVAQLPHVTQFRDVALHFDVAAISALIRADDSSKDPSVTKTKKQVAHFAKAMHAKLFALEPSAVLQRMAQTAELPIANHDVRTGVAAFLAAQPDFNIRTTSIHTALTQPNAFTRIAEGSRAAVAEQLKTLQRVQAISPTAQMPSRR